MRYLFLTLLIISSLHSKMIMTPFEAIHLAYGDNVIITKKNVLLNKTQAKQISKIAKQKLTTKIYRVFKIQKNKTIVAYAVLTVNKMRTKDAVVLYIVDLKGVITNITTVAFNEPPEFSPNKNWVLLFKDKTKKDMLRVGKDIPTITGATLSARGYAKGARLALGVFEVILRK